MEFYRTTVRRLSEEVSFQLCAFTLRSIVLLMMRRSSLMLPRCGRISVLSMSTTSPAVSPKDYLKSWLGSDLGASPPIPAQARNSTSFSSASKVEARSVVETPGDNSLKRLSLISLQVDWRKDVTSVIAGIAPTARPLSCFLNLRECTYSEKDILELVCAYREYGYEIICTNVPVGLRDVLKEKGINFVMTHTKEGLMIHSVPSTQVEVTSTQINIPTKKKSSGSNEVAVPGVENKLQVGTVRSGQQIYAEDCSLTVMGAVNEGAEIMSDGDIYVFGKLRGRVVAGLGARDATRCRIFVTQFEASLVGIQSVFVVPEDHLVEYQLLKGKDVCISLEPKQSSGTEKHAAGTGPLICAIDCDDDHIMVFRRFL